MDGASWITMVASPSAADDSTIGESIIFLILLIGSTNVVWEPIKEALKMDDSGDSRSTDEGIYKMQDLILQDNDHESLTAGIIIISIVLIITAVVMYVYWAGVTTSCVGGCGFKTGTLHNSHNDVQEGSECTFNLRREGGCFGRRDQPCPPAQQP